MRFLQPSSLLILAGVFVPGSAGGQILFDWPIRAVPQPEAVITGAGAVFWNPGGLAEGVGTTQEIWITHINGPDATGIGGVALAGTLDLPLGFRAGLGYSHLGISDIPRTTDSPAPQPADIDVSEDALVVALVGNPEAPAGVGGGIRLQRASVAGDVQDRLEGDMGLHFRLPLSLSPRLGLAVRGLGQEPRILAGVEAQVPPVAGGRVPIQLGYGAEKRPGTGGLEQRFSIRGSWVERLFAGLGVTRWGEGNGWTTLWMLGLKHGRYSFSVLREHLANDFGAVHFFRASVELSAPASR